MASPDPDNSRDAQAVHWVVRVTHGEMSLTSEAELEAWLAADRRNRGAYLRAQAGLYAMEDAVIEQSSIQACADAPVAVNDNPAPDLSSRSRRGLFIIGGAIAATLVAALMVAPQILPTSKSAGTPPRLLSAERVENLPDGSVATLKNGARITFVISDGARKVTLLNGEARFEVAKNPAQPFVVQSGDVYAQATGTVYSVHRVGPTGGRVRVSEGSVLVWSRDERDQAVLLHAGGQLTLDPGPRPVQPTQTTAVALPSPELAQISLDNVSVRSAVIRFNRVNRTRIVIADPAIEDTLIVGLFRADDPEQFARAVAAITDAELVKDSGTIVIKSKKK